MSSPKRPAINQITGLVSIHSIDGPVTTVTVGDSMQGSGIPTGVGTARCRPEDAFDEEVGYGIALGRALSDLGLKLAEKSAALCVTKDEVARVGAYHRSTRASAPAAPLWFRAEGWGWLRRR